MDFRAFNVETRELGESGTFTGYASVFGNVDSYGTVFDKGAFARTISHHNGEFPCLFFHDPTRPVGMLSAQEDDKGLLVTCELDLDNPDGRTMYTGLKKRYIDRMSVGFDVVTREDVDGVTHFKEARLWEVSLITRNFAANELALVTDVRAACAGVQRVGKALKAGAADELRAALEETQRLLAAISTGDMMQDVRQLSALLQEDSPVSESDSREHSDLLEELRGIGRELKQLVG